MTNRCFILLIIFLVSINHVNGQKAFDALSKLNTAYPQEKLHLHFDRTSYHPGETAWLKAYVFLGSVPSALSRTLYVYLYDENGNVLDRKTAPIFNSAAASALAIPANVSASAVYVRAYTEFMRNFDSSFFYTTTIPLGTAGRSAAPVTSTGVQLTFFPEGGSLIDGVKSRIAFKATDEYGLPYAVAGDIVNEEDRLLVSFNTAHDGMGSFSLRPLIKKTYTAIWKDNKGVSQKTPLPEIKPSGVALSIQNNGDVIEYVLENKSGETGNNDVVIICQINQQMLYLANANFVTNKLVGGTIPLKDAPAGIMQIVVLSADNRVLAERLVFINKSKYPFVPVIEPASLNFGKRAENILYVDVPDTLETNLSISVTDADYTDRRVDDKNIVSQLLLTGDIKNYIYNPSYYFMSQNDSVSKHLDLVMMTNRWERFNWEETLAGKFPEIKYKLLNYLSYDGTVAGLIHKNKAGKSSLAGIVETAEGRQVLDIALDSADHFLLTGMVFYDTATWNYQLKTDKKTNASSYKIDMRSITEDIPSFWIPSAALKHQANIVSGPREQGQTGSTAGIRENLATVVKKGSAKSAKQLFAERYASGVFAATSGTVFNIEDDNSARNFPSIIDFLLSNVGGLVRQDINKLALKGDLVTFFINQANVSVEQVHDLSMIDVSMIKLIPPPFIGSPLNGPGVAIYLKKGKITGTGSEVINLPGYSAKPVFQRSLNSQTDNSSTLYWNPGLLVKKNDRRIKIPFTNTDTSKRFLVVVEGFDKSGKLARIEKILQ